MLIDRSLNHCQPGNEKFRLVYLVTHNVTFRAHRNRRNKARFAGNIENIGKKRNAVAAVSVGSLRASR